MPALSDVLTGFAQAIVRGDELPAQIDAAYPNYSAATALEVYRNNYRGNLHDTLAGAYPVVKQLVGDDFFRYMARKFIEQYPSSSGNLHHYGAEVADFLASFGPAQGLSYLPDVAALEWACHRAYFAEDASPLDLSELAQIPPDQYSELVLYTHPSSHQVRSRYPVVAIWRAHQPGADPDFMIDPDSGASNAMVCRNDGAVIVDELSPADSHWLQAIRTGATLGDATTATLETDPEFDLQAVLLKLVAQGVLSGFKLKE
jgi:hypothetical protein